MDFTRTGGCCFTRHPAPGTLSTVFSTDQAAVCTWMTQVTRDNCLPFASQMIPTPGLLKCGHGPGDASALISAQGRMPGCHWHRLRRAGGPNALLLASPASGECYQGAGQGIPPPQSVSLRQWLSTFLVWHFNKVNVVMTFNRKIIFVATS